MIDIKISADEEVTVKNAVTKLFSTKLKDFPAGTHSLFVDAYSATEDDMDGELWEFLDQHSITDQGILLVYLMEEIATN